MPNFFLVLLLLSCLLSALTLPAQSAQLRTAVDDRLKQADRCQRKREPQRGIKLCDIVLQTAPDSVRACLIKSRCLADLGKQDEALDLIKRALKIDPRSAQAHLCLGQYNLAHKDDRGAESEMQLAVKLDKNDLPAWHALALLEERLKHSDKALAAYNSMVAADATSKDNYVLRGDFLTRQGKVKEALADYSFVLGRDSKNLEVRKKRAALYFQQGSYVQALADYCDVTGANPYDEDAFASRAEVRLAMKQYKEGLTDASKSISLDTDDGHAYYVRGKIYQAMGQNDLGRADLKKASALNYNGPGDYKGTKLIP